MRGSSADLSIHYSPAGALWVGQGRRSIVKKVIVLTDGDQQAWRAARRAVSELGLGLIDITGGNPTSASVREVEEAILASPQEVVVVMADDAGISGVGPGERLIEALASSSVVEIVAAIAVASWAHQDAAAVVDKSVTADGRLVATAVDKEGRPLPSRRLRGDTVGVLNDLGVPVVGVGDIGEEDHACDASELRQALLEALRLAEPATAAKILANAAAYPDWVD